MLSVLRLTYHNTIPSVSWCVFSWIDLLYLRRCTEVISLSGDAIWQVLRLSLPSGSEASTSRPVGDPSRRAWRTHSGYMRYVAFWRRISYSGSRPGGAVWSGGGPHREAVRINGFKSSIATGIRSENKRIQISVHRSLVLVHYTSNLGPLITRILLPDISGYGRHFSRHLQLFIGMNNPGIG